MQLAFETKRLREICTNEEKAIEDLGTQKAARLKARIADLRAAATIEDLPDVVRPRRGSVRCRINFAGESVIAFCANHNDNPTLEPGKIDWSKVRRIRILEIG